MNYLTLGSMIRNEEHYVQEWLAFHYLQGFEQFVIVLHQCTDRTEDKIRALPFADKVRIHKVVSDTPQAQMSAFVWIAENYGKTTEWLMFCDSDEFSFGTETDDFREILQHYEIFGGLFLNWMEYGHDNRRERPDCLCVEAYTTRAKKDYWAHQSGKSIIKPKELLRPYAPASPHAPLGHSFLSPHMFKTDKMTVHTDFTPISYCHWWLAKHVCHDIARCNHYRLRSLQDWVQKCERGNGNDAKAGHGNYVKEWEQADYHTVYDTSAARFSDRIKEILQ